MGTSDQIMFGTNSTMESLAQQLAESLDLFHGVAHGNSHFLNRRAAGDPTQIVKGLLIPNPSEDDLAPEEVSVTDGYPATLDVSLAPKSDSKLHEESRRLFDDLALLVDVPMIYLHDNALVAAYQPGQGVTELDGVSAGVGGEPTWRPFALDRSQLALRIQQ